MKSAASKSAALWKRIKGHKNDEKKKIGDKIKELESRMDALTASVNNIANATSSESTTTLAAARPPLKTYKTSGPFSLELVISCEDPLPGAEVPPPGASQLLKFMGSCEVEGVAQGVALFVGIPFKDNKSMRRREPLCYVVGYTESTRWTPGAEVTVTLDGKTVKGEIANVHRTFSWLCTVELFEQVGLDVPLPKPEDAHDFALIVRQGNFELTGRINRNFGFALPAGVIPGVKLGDLMVCWDRKGKLVVGGIVFRAYEDGKFFGLPPSSFMFGLLESQRPESYFIKYPDRRPELPKW